MLHLIYRVILEFISFDLLRFGFYDGFNSSEKVLNFDINSKKNFAHEQYKSL